MFLVRVLFICTALFRALKKKTKPLNLKIHSSVGSCENLPTQRSPLHTERSLRSFFFPSFIPSTPPVHVETPSASKELFFLRAFNFFYNYLFSILVPSGIYSVLKRTSNFWDSFCSLKKQVYLSALTLQQAHPEKDSFSAALQQQNKKQRMSNQAVQ